MSKNILILSTGNSCRSILAEAILNRYLHGVTAYSAGMKPLAKVHPHTQKTLQDDSSWKDTYHPKSLQEVQNERFDLVVVVCEESANNIPAFDIPTLYMEYDALDKKELSVFKKTLKTMQMELTPIIRMQLGL